MISVLESKNGELPATEFPIDEPNETPEAPVVPEVTEITEFTEDRAEVTEASPGKDEAEASRRKIFKSRPRKLDFSGKVSLRK
jgi:hypothetical protein